MATHRQQWIARARAVGRACADSASVFLRDVGNGLLEVSHNSLALVGLVVVAAAAFVAGQTELRHSIEAEIYGWLQARQERRADPTELAAASLAEPDAVARATAAHPKDLTRQQAAVALWLARRYRVAPEPVSRLVQEAWAVGPKVGVDPTLILAIMAIESSFNPFAQSPVGAQGLMQVMTRVHDDKYESFGGKHAAFDPISNVRVGVLVLKECITRAGSLQEGLRYYVGAALLEGDGGYVGRVLAEQALMRGVADGRNVAVNSPNTAPAAAAREADGAASRPATEPLAKPEAPDRVAMLR